MPTICDWKTGWRFDWYLKISIVSSRFSLHQSQGCHSREVFLPNGRKWSLVAGILFRENLFNLIVEVPQVSRLLLGGSMPRHPNIHNIYLTTSELEPQLSKLHGMKVMCFYHLSDKAPFDTSFPNIRHHLLGKHCRAIITRSFAHLFDPLLCRHPWNSCWVPVFWAHEAMKPTAAECRAFWRCGKGWASISNFLLNFWCCDK